MSYGAFGRAVQGLGYQLAGISLSRQDQRFRTRMEELELEWERQLRGLASREGTSAWRGEATSLLNQKLDNELLDMGWFERRRYTRAIEASRLGYQRAIEKAQPDYQRGLADLRGDAQTFKQMFLEGRAPKADFREAVEGLELLGEEEEEAYRLVSRAIERYVSLEQAAAEVDDAEAFQRKVEEIFDGTPLESDNPNLQAAIANENSAFQNWAANAFSQFAPPGPNQVVEQQFIGKDDLPGLVKALRGLAQGREDVSAAAQEGFETDVLDFRGKQVAKRKMLQFDTMRQAAAERAGEAWQEILQQHQDPETLQEALDQSISSIVEELREQAPSGIAEFVQQSVQRLQQGLRTERDGAVQRLEESLQEQAVTGFTQGLLARHEAQSLSYDDALSEFDAKADAGIFPGLDYAGVLSVRGEFQRSLADQDLEQLGYEAGLNALPFGKMPGTVSYDGVPGPVAGVMQLLEGEDARKPFGYSLEEIGYEGDPLDEGETLRQTFEFMKNVYRDQEERDLEQDLEGDRGRVFAWLQEQDRFPALQGASADAFSRFVVGTDGTPPNFRELRPAGNPARGQVGFARGLRERQQLLIAKDRDQTQQRNAFLAEQMSRAQVGEDWTDEPWMTEVQRRNLQSAHAKATRLAREYQKVQQAIGNPQQRLNPFNKDMQQSVDFAFDQQGKGAALFAGDPQVTMEVLAEHSATGYLPKGAEDVVRSLTMPGATAEQMDRGMGMLGQMKQVVGTAHTFGKAALAEQERYAFIRGRLGPEAAFGALVTERALEIDALKDYDAFDEIAEALDETEFEDLERLAGLRTNTDWWDPGVDARQENPQFRSEVLALALRRYQLNGGDLEGSLREAAQALRPSWGRQPVGYEDERRLNVSYAPLDKLFPGFTSYEWVDRQIRTALPTVERYQVVGDTQSLQDGGVLLRLWNPTFGTWELNESRFFPVPPEREEDEVPDNPATYNPDAFDFYGED